MSLGWQVSTMLIQVILNLVFITVMARLVDKSAFGAYALLNATIGIINIFTQFGFGAALIQRDENNKFHISFAFYATLVIGFLAYLALFFLGDFVAVFYDHKFPAIALKLIGLLIIIRSLGIISKSLLIRNLAFKKLFYAQVISYFIGNIVVGISMAYYKFDLWALIMALLVTNFLLSVFYFIFQPHSLAVLFQKKESKEVFKYGKNLTFARLFNQLALNYDKFLLAKAVPFDTLGLYERSQRLIFLPKLYIGTTLDSILFSVMSKVRHNIEKAQNLYFRFISICTIILVFIFLNVAFFSEELILIVLGNNWDGAGPIFRALSILIVTDILSKFGNTVARSFDRLEESVKIKSMFAAAIIIGCTIGLKWGIMGVITAYVLASIFHNFLMVKLSLKILNSSLGQFFTEIKPVFKLSFIIILKNIIVIVLLGKGVLTMFLCIGLDLVITALIVWYRPSILEIKNFEFVIDMLETINHPFGTRIKNKLSNLIENRSN